jgi:hypothetical protein
MARQPNRLVTIRNQSKGRRGDAQQPREQRAREERSALNAADHSTLRRVRGAHDVATGFPPRVMIRRRPRDQH